MAATPIADLLQLPMAEQAALPVDGQRREELDRRWDAHMQNPTTAVPWDQIRGLLERG